MRAVFVAIVVSGVCGLLVEASDLPRDRAPRSHIQPVGELAAARDSEWAGLVTSRAPAVVREQFRLERGAGLVVESVHDGSVADRAGIRQHDVLVALDGQLLLLPEQFTALIEASAADAPLECRLIRAGVEKMVSLKPRTPAVAGGILQPAASTLELLPKKPKSLVATVTELPDGSLQQSDADYVVKLSAGDDRRLVVRDARGRIIFNGPIETPEQQSRIPPEVRARVAGLERLGIQRQARQSETGAGGADRPPPARIGTLDIQPVEIR